MEPICADIQKRVATDFSTLVAERKTAAFGGAVSEHSQHIGNCGACLSSYSSKLEKGLSQHSLLASASLGMAAEAIEKHIKNTAS